MKKIYNLFALVMLFAIAVGAQAQERYYSVSDDAEPCVSEPQAGVAYAIIKGNATDIWQKAYLTHEGTVSTTYATAETLWYFEPAGENQYRIYFEKDGVKNYIHNGRGDFATTANSQIGVYSFQPAFYFENAEAAQEAEVTYYSTTDGANEDENVILSLVETEEVMGVEGWTPAYLHWTGAVNRNTVNNYFYVVPITRMDDASYYDAVIFDLFGENGFDRENYETGINPGNYSEDAVNALEAAVDAFDGSDETAKALYAALEAVKASFVNFGEGYYIFTTFRSSTGALFDNTKNVCGATAHMYTYTDPAVAITHTQNGTEFSIGDWDVYDPDDDSAWLESGLAAYIIWHVTPNPAKEGMYFVQNRKTKRYIGTPGLDKKSNTPIPTVETANASFNMEPSQYKNDQGVIAWRFYSDELVKVGAWGGAEWKFGGLHAPGDVLNMVTWNYEADGSCWVPRTVTQDMMDLIDANGIQPELNMNLKTVVAETEAAINGAKAYAFFDAAGKRLGDVNVLETIEPDGLVKSAEQITTNANQPNDGIDVAGLVDGDLSQESFFHSAWKDSDAPKGEREILDPETGEGTGEYEEYCLPHYLQFDLQKSVKDLTVKFFTRGNGSVTGRLNRCAIYVSTTGGEEDSEWTLLKDSAEFHYTAFDAAHKVTVAGETYNSYVGFATIDLGGSYQYVRIEHSTPVHNEARPWMNAAEIRLYEGKLVNYQYDPECKYEMVSQATRDALVSLLATAKAELADGKATQATIDALKAALEKFKSELPDPAGVKAAYDEARAFAAAVEAEQLIGTGVGYFEKGADTELNAALDKIEVKDGMTVEECVAAKEAIAAALAAFNAKMHKLTDGQVYQIQARTKGGETWFNNLSEEDQAKESNQTTLVKYYADCHYVGTRGGNAFNVAWSAEQGEEEDGLSADYPAYLWKAEKAEGGFRLKHLLTGRYLGWHEDSSEAHLVALTDTFQTVFDLRSAKKAGVVNLVLNEGQFLNAQPGTNNVVTWGVADGYDNSAFGFVPAEESFSKGYTIDVDDADGLRVMTLPVAVSNPGTDAYTVLGYTVEGENTYIELKKVTSIPANTAFLVEVEDGEVWFDNVTPGTDKWTETCVNGLQNVTKQAWKPGAGFLTLGKYNGELAAVQLDKNDVVGVGYGFFTAEMPQAAGKGDLSILCPDGLAKQVIEGVQTIVAGQAASKGTFNLMGQKVAGKLPAGLYIVNGQKVLVK